MEVAAILHAQLFGRPEAPVERVGGSSVPTPAAAELEAALPLPQQRVVDAVLRTLRPGGIEFPWLTVIRIPRVRVAVSRSNSSRLLVDAGDQVDEGAPIYVIATEKVEQEIEAGASEHRAVDRAGWRDHETAPKSARHRHYRSA